MSVAFFGVVAVFFFLDGENSSSSLFVRSTAFEGVEAVVLLRFFVVEFGLETSDRGAVVSSSIVVLQISNEAHGFVKFILKMKSLRVNTGDSNARPNMARRKAAGAYLREISCVAILIMVNINLL